MLFFFRALILSLYTIAVSLSSMVLFFVLYSYLTPYMYILITIVIFNITISFLITFPIIKFFERLNKKEVNNESEK